MMRPAERNLYLEVIVRTLNLQQAAEFLQLHPQTLRQKARAGEIPGARPGKSWCFLEDDLVEYLRSLYAPGRQVPQRAKKEHVRHAR